MTDLEELRNLADHYNLTLGAKLVIAGACDEIQNLREEIARLTATEPQEVPVPAETEHQYSREKLEGILANRWPSVFCKEGHHGTPNQFAKNLVAFFGSHPRAEIPTQPPAGGALERDPALFDILNSALGTMHYHRLMGALNSNGYVITRGDQVK